MNQFAIDLATVQVHASRPDCLQFPATASLNSFSLVPGTMTLKSAGTETWPDVDIGGALQRATLWVFVKVANQWHAAGVERLRPDQVNGTKPEAHIGPRDIETIIGEGWAGKSEFGIMRGFNPSAGDPVGVMLVSGSTRLDDRPTVRQRSNVLVVTWPAVTGAAPCRVLWDERGDDPTSTGSVIDPEMLTTVTLSHLEAELERLSQQVAECASTVDRCSQQLRSIQTQLRLARG